MEFWLVCKLASLGEQVGNLDELVVQVDPSDLAAKCTSEISSGTADAASNIEDTGLRGELDRGGLCFSRRQPAAMEMVNGSQDFGCEVFWVVPRVLDRCENAVTEATAGIVLFTVS